VSNEKTFALLVEALGQAAGEPDAAPGADGVFRFQFEGRPFCLLPRGDSVLFYAAVGALPEDPQEADHVRIGLLSANVLFRDTFGACLGALPEDGTVCLSCLIPMNALTGLGFVRAADNFARLAGIWEERLAEMNKQVQAWEMQEPFDEEAAGPTGPPFPPTGGMPPAFA
jgi:hypothetical protein